MPETVHLDQDLGVIRVRSWGDVTIDDWNHSKSEVVRLHTTAGVDRLLVDVTEQTSAPSTLDIFDFGSDWPPSISVAIVTGDATRDDQEFLENVAMNRSRTMRTFADVEQAMAWLTNRAD